MTDKQIRYSPRLELAKTWPAFLVALRSSSITPGLIVFTGPRGDQALGHRTTSQSDSRCVWIVLGQSMCNPVYSQVD